MAELSSVTGPWGVVLWDSRHAEFVVAVDPLGIQPLFWAPTASGGIAVSSEMASLADHHDVDDALDLEGVLISSLFPLWAPSVADRTSFESIRRIPGGHALRISPGGRGRVIQYWNAWALPGEDDSSSLTECSALLRDRMNTAINRSIEGTNAVGAHVSGGVDSTAVACRAHQLLRDRGQGGLVAGYSWSPSDALVPRVVEDERDRIDEVAHTSGFPMRFRTLEDSAGEFSVLDPDRYPWTIITDEAFVMVKAAADGAQVMLSGFGGDEAASFKGNRVRAVWARGGHLDRVVRQAWQAEALSGAPVSARTAAAARQLGGGLADLLPPMVNRAVHPQRAVRARRLNERAVGMLGSDFPAAADARRERIDRAAAARTPREVMITKLTEGYIQQRINSWYQRGRRFGIDYRYPLLDLDVVTAAVSMPTHAFAFHGHTRTAYRLAIRSWTPPGTAWFPTKSEQAFRLARRLPHLQKPERKRRAAEIEETIARVSRAIAPRG